MRSFIGVTVHFIEGTNIESGVIGVTELHESHTANYLVEVFINILLDWGINQNQAVVDYFGEKRHLSCLAHNINLIVEKNICKTQEENPKTKVKTGGVPDLLNKTGNEFPEMLSARDLQSLKEVCMLLGVIEKLTRELSTEKYVMSISMIEKLHPQLTNDCDTNNINIEHDNEMTSNSSIDLWSLHKTLEKKYRNKTKSGSHVRDEIRSYLDKGVVGLKDKPIIEWENIKGAFLNLYTLAKKYLSVSVTSVPSERLFSRTENIHVIMTKSRNRLLGSRLSKLVFLQSLDNKYWQ
ncbi:hypothetical protein AGLY_009704 [Aphis glycines]|uniref:HAT C-terminal dimerisation domain-containing protein n=1 Tax=Aphis glycines TaxID=307491 RepID=A0A6G0TGZ7_APHGL|nr:hypothetical protein AGLY_009704 [Aphis glycines]